jgi:hypothetical protein
MKIGLPEQLRNYIITLPPKFRVGFNAPCYCNVFTDTAHVVLERLRFVDPKSKTYAQAIAAKKITGYSKNPTITDVRVKIDTFISLPVNQKHAITLKQNAIVAIYNSNESTAIVELNTIDLTKYNPRQVRENIQNMVDIFMLQFDNEPPPSGFLPLPEEYVVIKK